MPVCLFYPDSSHLCAQIITHINEEYGVDLDTDVTTPKTKGNFKGSHTAVFESRKVVTIS